MRPAKERGAARGALQNVTAKKRFRLGPAAWGCALLLFLLFGGAAYGQGGGATKAPQDIHGFLEETFDGFFYHGAYLDEESRYLVVSLKVHPGSLSDRLQRGDSSLDEILAREVIEDLFSRPFSIYLLGLPAIHGVSVILTWDGCQRTRDPEGKEKILLREGISEFDRFDLSRTLYFDKLARVERASDPLSAGRLFDQIEFSHLRGDTYRGISLHSLSNIP